MISKKILKDIEITHLISTTKFIKLITSKKITKKHNHCIEDSYTLIKNYVDFISQKPELWMFIPCDENNNVLKEPISSDKKYNTYNIVQSTFNVELYNKDILEFQQAQKKVLFKGWKYTNKNEYKVLKNREGGCIFLNDFKKHKSIESLFFTEMYKYELTKTALKQIKI